MLPIMKTKNTNKLHFGLHLIDCCGTPDGSPCEHAREVGRYATRDEAIAAGRQMRGPDSTWFQVSEDDEAGVTRGDVEDID